MTEFDISLLNSDKTLKKGYASLVNNAGKAIAVITLAVTALVTFTEIGFIGGINQSVSAEVMLLLLASYLMYFSMESAGEKLGRESEEYRAAFSEYKEKAVKIKPTSIYALREFCKEYSKKELLYRTENFLMSHGLTYGEYERYCAGERFDLKNEACFRKAARMKPARLTPQMLLSIEKSCENELTSPQKTKLFSTLVRLLPITVSVFFTGAMVLAAKDGLDAMTVIEGLVKLSALPIIGIRAYCWGYSYAREGLSAWLITKSKLLDAFSSDSIKDQESEE